MQLMAAVDVRAMNRHGKRGFSDLGEQMISRKKAPQQDVDALLAENKGEIYQIALWPDDKRIARADALEETPCTDAKRQ